MSVTTALTDEIPAIRLNSCDHFSHFHYLPTVGEALVVEGKSVHVGHMTDVENALYEQ